MKLTMYQRGAPAAPKQAYFPLKPIKAVDKWQLLRKIAKKDISAEAQLKLEWIIYYYTKGEKNAKGTATQFGITRKTMHKWLKRFNDKNLKSLEEESRAPTKTRQRQISFIQRTRIINLRRKHMKYGKMKLRRRYFKEYGETISSWKIQKVIEEESLYPDKGRAEKLRRKQQKARLQKHQRITKLKKIPTTHFLWHVDTVILTIPAGGYRYLLTAIDEVSKLAFARLYATHSSRQAKDFLERLMYLTDKRIINLHHDNGSEFKDHFERACDDLNLPQWLSRPYTPKDNPVLERFNRTIQEEFIDQTDISLDSLAEFNANLLDWLIEYNSIRPHQALDYLTPLEYLEKEHPQVSPMSSSHTPSCLKAIKYGTLPRLENL